MWNRIFKTNNKTAYYPGQIRIIGGRWRGHKLLVTKKPGMRPTPDRVRETLFNWLAPVIKNARCLDCFAGSGALGLEALSRGAGSVTLLEQNYKVSIQLVKNLQILQTQQAQVITVNSLRWLAQQGDSFDVVFIDPPFRQNMIPQTINTLERYQRLANEASVYIETEADGHMPDVPSNWQLHRGEVTGQVAYRLYLRHAKPKKNYDNSPTQGF